MDANEFFDFAQEMVTDIFNENGTWVDQAVAWTGEGRKIALIELHRSEEEAPERLRSVVLENGLPAFAVAYEARLTGSDAGQDARRGGPRVFDNTVAIADEADGGRLPEHVLFIFMEAEDGASRCRAFEVVGAGKKRIGRRAEELEASSSPFSGVYARPALRH